MELSTAKDIFSEASGYEGTAIRFTGWGEPLLHPKIADFVIEAKKRSLPLKVYTNGLSLTPKLMDTFMEAGLDDLQFSLQGLSPFQYEFNRRGARYSDLFKNIKMASERRGRAKVPFISILTSVLAHELEEGDPEAFTEEFLRYADKVAVDLTNLNFVKNSDKAKPYLDKQSEGLKRGLCVDVFLAMEIKYDGSIQFCGQDSEGRDSHTAGRFGEISLKDAWSGPRFEKQRKLVGRELGHAKSPVCVNCFHNTTKYDLFKERLKREGS
jgi:hypothetical protein